LGLKVPDDENVQSLSTFVLEMARYDVDTDLRDRSRFMTAMMGLAPSSENAAGEAVQVDEDSLAELADHAGGPEHYSAHTPSSYIVRANANTIGIILAQKPPPTTQVLKNFSRKNKIRVN